MRHFVFKAVYPRQSPPSRELSCIGCSAAKACEEANLEFDNQRVGFLHIHHASKTMSSDLQWCSS